MNPNTGHLIALRRGEALPDGYEAVPRELQADAQRKLMRAMRPDAGPRPEAQVNLRSSTPLSLWAKKKRLAKIAAQSRRRNRK